MAKNQNNQEKLENSGAETVADEQKTQKKNIAFADIEAIKVIASLNIIGHNAKDDDIVWDLGTVKITAGCIRQAKALLE